MTTREEARLQYIKDHPTPYPKMYCVNNEDEERKLYAELRKKFGEVAK